MQSEAWVQKVYVAGYANSSPSKRPLNKQSGAESCNVKKVAGLSGLRLCIIVNGFIIHQKGKDMNQAPRFSSVLLLSFGLALGLGGCTYYQTAPGVYAPMPSTFERSWSAAIGAMEDEGVRILNVDRDAGKASGVRGSISVAASVQPQSDTRVRVEFSTSGNTAADPTLIDRITARYNARMGR